MESIPTFKKKSKVNNKSEENFNNNRKHISLTFQLSAHRSTNIPKRNKWAEDKLCLKKK